MEWITQHINVECVLYNIANSFVFIIACVRIVILQQDFPLNKESKKIEAKRIENWGEKKENDAKNLFISFAKRSEKKAKRFLFRFVSLWSEKK